MSGKKQYWLRDESGDHALVTGADERDRLVREGGWTETDEPSEGFVYVWREGCPAPGRVSVEALPVLWEPRGFAAGPPPGSAHPAEVQAARAVAEQATAEPAETKTRKSTAGGDAEKEVTGA